MGSKCTKSFYFAGKRYFVHGSSEKEVTEKMILMKRDLEEGRVIYNGKTTVGQWAETAIETYKTAASEKTLQDAKYMLKKYILPQIGSVPIRSVRAIQCQQILNAAEGMSYSTVTKIQMLLKFIFEKARENKMIYENPAAGLVKPKCVKGSRRSLTKNETEHFLRVCKDDKYLVFLLMYYCGCRSEEAMGAEGRDVICRGEHHLLHIRGTKTANSDRAVPLPEAMYQRIRNVEPFAPLAPNSSGRHHTKSSYSRCSESLKRDMNIDMGCRVYRNKLIPPLPLADDFVPYDLRHTYCTNLQKAGVDIRTAQKLMGHADIKMTANIYTHVDDDEILKAADLIEGLEEKSAPKVLPNNHQNTPKTDIEIAESDVS